MAGDITRMTFNVLNFMNSETIESFSNEEIGQWMRLWGKAVLLAKECSLSDDLVLLAKYANTTPRKLSQRVIEQFPVVLTEYGPRRRNKVQYDVWCELCEKSEVARASRQAGLDKRAKERALESTNRGNERSTNDERTPDGRSTNRTEENRTEENRTEHSSSPDTSCVDEVSEEQRIADEKANAIAGRKKGDPGYFRRGQYPGISPKDVWKHCSKAWIQAKGDSAYCRMPTKHPSAKTDTFADLCDRRGGGDIIVPAFELWIQEEGKYIDTQWPLGEFLKGETAKRYMELVKPLNEVKPKLTVETIQASKEISKQQHEAFFSSPKVEVTSEPGAEAFFNEENL